MTNNTLAERVREMMEGHRKTLHENTNNCIAGHEGELWLPTEAAELALEEMAKELLEEIMAEVRERKRYVMQKNHPAHMVYHDTNNQVIVTNELHRIERDTRIACDSLSLTKTKDAS